MSEEPRWGFSLPFRRPPKPAPPPPHSLEERLLRMNGKERERTWAGMVASLVSLVDEPYRKEARAAADGVESRAKIALVVLAIRNALPAEAARNFSLVVRAIAEVAKVA